MSGRLARFAWLRLLVGGLCAGAGALAVLPAPNSLLWKVGLAVTEWGYWLAPLALTPLLPGWRRTWAGRLGAALGVTGAALAVSSLLRAAPTAAQVPAALDAALGTLAPPATPDAPPRPRPLVALDLLRGYAAPGVQQRSVVFATPDGQALQMDVYQGPAPAHPAPGLITIHGGSWQSGGRGDLPALNRYFAARGYVVAALDYRLAPRWRFPTAVDDIHAAITYLKAHAADFGLDPTRLVLLGRSAGGQLALLAAYTPSDPAIRGAVSLYGPTDLAWGYTHPTNPAVLDSQDVLGQYLGGSPTTVPAAYQAASPVNFVGPATPPTLLIHGDRDALVFVAHSEMLAARLAAAGRPHYFLRLPWADHGCDANLNGPCGQIALYTIERFLAAVLH